MNWLLIIQNFILTSRGFFWQNTVKYVTKRKKCLILLIRFIIIVVYSKLKHNFQKLRILHFKKKTILQKSEKRNIIKKNLKK